MKLLELTTETDGTTVRLALTGELDIAGAARVEQELERIEREPPTTIVLDLRELAFMDSTGLRVIVAADGRAREQARRLVVVRGSDTVQRIIEMTRLDERLEIVDDLAAVEAGSRPLSGLRRRPARCCARSRPRRRPESRPPPRAARRRA
jgi:anti-sigma B factor antagonist